MPLRVALKLLLPGIALACSSPAPPRRTTAAPETALRARPLATSQGAAPLVPWFARIPSLTLVSAAPLPSQHREGALSEIRVNPEAVESYRSLTRDSLTRGSGFDDGTLIVEWLRLPPTSTADVVFALERRGDVWRYWQADAHGQGHELEAGSACHGCHAGALASPLFGPPQLGVLGESKATPQRSL